MQNMDLYQGPKRIRIAKALLEQCDLALPAGSSAKIAIHGLIQGTKRLDADNAKALIDELSALAFANATESGLLPMRTESNIGQIQGDEEDPAAFRIHAFEALALALTQFVTLLSLETSVRLAPSDI